MKQKYGFNKSNFIAYLQKEVDRLEHEHLFTENNGWAQVQGRGEAINREYGKYAALKDILFDIENNHIEEIGAIYLPKHKTN